MGSSSGAGGGAVGAAESTIMKVKVINRVEQRETGFERKGDLKQVRRNLNPELHPFERAVEYTRALNAAKLERVFAKPFVAALSGHTDGINCLARNPKRLNSLVSGSASGELFLWDVPERRAIYNYVGHKRAVKAVTVSDCGSLCFSCGDEGVVKMWRVPHAPLGGVTETVDHHPVSSFDAGQVLRGIDHHWKRPLFATAGEKVEVWDHERASPLHSFVWGADSVESVRFNPVESDIFTSCGNDRSIALYDIRTGNPLHKLVMQTKTNSVAWNPIEAFNFTCANEDCCLYTYDMRRLDIAKMVHKDHVSAVLDVDYSPTGREFVSGSYDRSVRIFKYDGGHSRDVYHTKRMQRVFGVRFSGDGSYVFSASDDMNVRIWKARASQKMGTLLPREKSKQAYNAALVKRYGHMPEVKRITRHRHLPKAIYTTGKLRREVTESERKKQLNRIKHSAPGSIKTKPARKKKIVTRLE